jgi:hypothetical protein
MVMTTVSLSLPQSALRSWSEEDDPQIVIIQRVGVEHTDGSIRFTLCAHGDKGKAIGLTALTVPGNIDGCDISGL